MSGIALVTGANRGLGLETCRQLAAGGMHVVVSARAPETAHRAVDELYEELACRQSHAESPFASLEPLELDVTDERSIAAAFHQLRGIGRPIDILVNNAGIALEGFDAEVARRTIDVNVYGAERMTEICAPLFGDGARVVMVSSESGALSQFSEPLQRRFLEPTIDRRRLHALLDAFVDDVAAERSSCRGWPASAYAVSKAGLNALTRIFARERPQLRVNAVSPGWVRTRMGGSAASRSVSEGAASIVWATQRKVPTGGFFRDGHRLDW